MKELIQAIDRLPKILKILLCFPALDVVWSVYRIIKGITKNDSVLLVVGIVWLIGAFTLGWLFDMITVFMYDHPKLT